LSCVNLKCRRDDNVKTDLEEISVRAGRGFSWLRMGTAGIDAKAVRNLGFNNMRVIS
jgi:ribosomal protein L13E